MRKYSQTHHHCQYTIETEGWKSIGESVSNRIDTPPFPVPNMAMTVRVRPPVKDEDLRPELETPLTHHHCQYTKERDGSMNTDEPKESPNTVKEHL